MVECFEDKIVNALENTIADDGVIESYPNNRKCIDIAIDSPKQDYYIGIISQSYDGKGSSHISGLDEAIEYQQKSGRDIFVSILVDIDDYDKQKLLFPLEYFQGYCKPEGHFSDWDALIDDGVEWDRKISLDDLDEARVMAVPQL